MEYFLPLVRGLARFATVVVTPYLGIRETGARMIFDEMLFHVDLQGRIELNLVFPQFVLDGLQYPFSPSGGV